jgi:hypothetical protein
VTLLLAIGGLQLKIIDPGWGERAVARVGQLRAAKSIDSRRAVEVCPMDKQQAEALARNRG